MAELCFQSNLYLQTLNQINDSRLEVLVCDTKGTRAGGLCFQDFLLTEHKARFSCGGTSGLLITPDIMINQHFWPCEEPISSIRKCKLCNWLGIGHFFPLVKCLARFRFQDK
ncbi:hypothetical protein CsSME_00050795 [Camellia sinensis var. sinensis]